MTLDYETYAERYSCTECGQPATRESYEDYLELEAEREAKLAAMTPEERAEYDRKKAADDAIMAGYLRALWPEIRPESVVKPFVHKFTGLGDTE